GLARPGPPIDKYKAAGAANGGILLWSRGHSCTKPDVVELATLIAFFRSWSKIGGWTPIGKAWRNSRWRPLLFLSHSVTASMSFAPLSWETSMGGASYNIRTFLTAFRISSSGSP